MKDTTDDSFAAYSIPEFLVQRWRQDIYSKKILGDSSVVVDEYIYKCNYCVLLYSNSYSRTNVESQGSENVNFSNVTTAILIHPNFVTLTITLTITIITSP